MDAPLQPRLSRRRLLASLGLAAAGGAAAVVAAAEASIARPAAERRQPGPTDQPREVPTDD